MVLMLNKMHRYSLVFTLILVVFGLDQITKFLVQRFLELGESWPSEGIFRLTSSFNTGSAFGLFTGQNTPLILVSFLGIGFLAWIYSTQKHPRRLLTGSLALQLGGALGNLCDRLRIGYVVDFIDVGPWPIFNVADSAIVVGVITLGWLFLTNRISNVVPVDD